jgi:hypothetical protein
MRFIGFGMLILAVATVANAQLPEMPKPTKEHELLKQFAGEWNSKAETVPAPGQEAIKCEGTESAKMIGGFWLVNQGEGSMMGMPVNSVLTIGYDPATKKYVGTFLCSMDSTLWKYTGAFDATGKKLTLETEGPSPLDHNKKAKFREVLELTDKDHKEFRSLMQGDDGKWVEIVTVLYERKK